MPPVLVMALDSSTRAGSIAVVRGVRVLALIEGDPSRTHAERVPEEIERALECAGVEAGDLDLLVVSSGPGAFTGLRIGLAAIQGLAMVLDKPVVGVSALDALADAARVEFDTPIAAPVATWMDAHRGEVFTAAYRAAQPEPDLVVNPLVGSPNAMLGAVPFPPAADVTFVGDGAVHYRNQIQEARPAARVVETVPLLAPALARLGLHRAESGGAGPPHTLQPLYVRRPDAELDRERQAKA
jgi:tRNA threonylcarbamoyladenosine biosynthesis protein TsaB